MWERPHTFGCVLLAQVTLVDADGCALLTPEDCMDGDCLEGLVKYDGPGASTEGEEHPVEPVGGRPLVAPDRYLQVCSQSR